MICVLHKKSKIFVVAIDHANRLGGCPLSYEDIKKTIQKNIVTFTEEILSGKLCFLCSESLDEIQPVQWWDSNGNSIFRFTAPDIITEYNLAMRRVDLADILILIYHAPKKMKRGQLQVLMHFDA